MKTLLINKNSGHWCVHTVDGDIHVADIHYRGAGDWRCTVDRDDQEGSPEVEFALPAETLEEAHAMAEEKATQNGVIPRLEKIKAQYGRLPTLEEIEADTESEVQTLPEVYRAMFMGTLQMYYGQSRQLKCTEIYQSMLIEALANSLVESFRAEDIMKQVDASVVLLKVYVKEYVDKRTALIKKFESAASGLADALANVMSSGEDTDEPTTKDKPTQH